MLPALFGSIVLFPLLAFGLGWPLVARRGLTPAEKLVAATALSLLGVFLFAWGVFVFALPLATLWLLPVLALAGLAGETRTLVAFARDPEVRALCFAQGLVALSCLGWLATVEAYSGGGWSGDWFEHWERTRFFLERGPLDQKFLGLYSLPARPPLANVVTGALLFLTRTDFATYQVVSSLFASVVFLPAALLARRFGGDSKAITGCALLLLVNPLFVQNATFAWTKLPAAFFILTALYFFLSAQEPGRALTPALLGGASLAAGLLAHFSAGPYAVMLTVLWLALGRSQGRRARWWRQTALAGLAGALVLAAWFGWSLSAYGAAHTFLSNSSVTAADATAGSQIVKIGRNIFDTVVPHFLRPLDPALIVQHSPWGYLRDFFFQCYQVNLPLALGSMGSIVVAREAWRAAGEAPATVRWYWTTLVVGVMLLGIGTHGARDEWGLAHICLQALVVLALAFLAARWPRLSPRWQRALMAGAAFDFLLGIVLQFAVQNFYLDHLLTPLVAVPDVIASYNSQTAFNAYGVMLNHLDPFGAGLALPFPAVAGAQVVLLWLLLRRVRSA